jgi:hypothetical protein
MPLNLSMIGQRQRWPGLPYWIEMLYRKYNQYTTGTGKKQTEGRRIFRRKLVHMSSERLLLRCHMKKPLPAMPPTEGAWIYSLGLEASGPAFSTNRLP